MGDITLNDIKKLIDDLKKELKQDIEKSNYKLNNKISTLETNLKNEIEKSNKELKKEIKNNSYKIEMLQSKSNKPNNFLDALSPAAAVGSQYHKTNSFYSE